MVGINIMLIKYPIVNDTNIIIIISWKAKQLKLKYKEDFKKMVRDKWKQKAMHGKFPNYLDKDHVDVELPLK